ncbi:hypothetical protein IscW_ISCW008229 [Ixodes scapularis]|uniref:Uncharacterized protein n=1 Tax=Ixodes scapularis TaxID=6945 RepID=B7PS18_IXOSC|nr:hypothetical protein IscW_ISCW008229 [Ixodes scapularis]|eukprot:XP_002401772.1 hypothetical protein IscW_ISCW008229 [Ixodes scapularis]
MTSLERFYPPDTVVCHFCDLRIPSRIKMGEHYLSKHGCQLVWRCSICQTHTYTLSTSESMSSHYRTWSEADLRVLACGELRLPPRTKFVNMELAKGYKGLTWQTIKDCRAKKLYRGVLRQEQARLRSVTPATALPATPHLSRQPSSSPIPAMPKQHVPTTKARIESGVLRLSNTKQRAQRGQVQSPTSPPYKPDNRPWTADDTRALALSELQAPAAMVCDEELAALLPRRTWKSVGDHRR